MTREQFEREIARLLRRVELLRAAARGDARLARVDVRGHYVRRHWVEPHVRLVGARRPRSRS